MNNHLLLVLLLLLFLCERVTLFSPTPQPGRRKERMTIAKLPEKLIVAYTHNKCETLKEMDKVTRAVQEGVNVLIWVFIRFDITEDKVTENNDKLKGVKVIIGQDVNNFRQYKQKLVSMGFGNIKHLTAFGGWNGNHLPAGFSAENLYEAFQEFNLQFFSEDNTPLFDGINWDLEGHNNLQSPTNVFSKECLDQMVDFTKLAREDGYIVTMGKCQNIFKLWLFFHTTISTYFNLLFIAIPFSSSRVILGYNHQRVQPLCKFD